MVNLLYFLTRYGSLLTFLLLGFLSLYLIVRFNQTQRDIYFNSSRFYSGVLLEKTNQVAYLTSMQRVADSLAAENAQLYSRLYNQLASPAFAGIEDTLLSAFDFLPARIIKNSFHLPNNNLTLNKGEQDGVREGMGVMLPQGVLGIVRSTSPRFSRVISLLNSQSHISVASSRSGAFGSLTWDGRDPGIVILEEVPKHQDITLGDTIITSGFSAIFPRDIPIGTVQGFYVPPGSSTYRIEVRMFADLTRINQAYIIRNLHMDELQQLEQNE
jgi:rod shape-determining protein MreC